MQIAIEVGQFEVGCRKAGERRGALRGARAQHPGAGACIANHRLTHVTPHCGEVELVVADDRMCRIARQRHTDLIATQAFGLPGPAGGGFDVMAIEP